MKCKYARMTVGTRIVMDGSVWRGRVNGVARLATVTNAGPNHLYFVSDDGVQHYAPGFPDVQPGFDISIARENAND